MRGGNLASDADHDGPCLELIALRVGDAVVGTLFPLRHGIVDVGSVVVAGVFLPGAPLKPCEAKVWLVNGVWHFGHVERGRPPCFVDGQPVGALSQPLKNGSIIILSAGIAELRFHARRPAFTGVERHGSWVTFNPWSREPHLANAIHVDTGAVGTASLDPTWYPRSQPRALRVLDARGTTPEPLPRGPFVVEDIAGVRFSDLLWRTAEQRAALDGRVLLAAAQLACEGAGDLRRSQLHVSFGGLLVWHGLGVGAAGDHPNVEERAILAAHLTAIAAGCTATGTVSVLTLMRHNDDLANMPLDGDVKRALQRMLRVAIDQPALLAQVVREERRELGGLSTDEVAGLVAHVFPEKHDAHRRVMESALVAGAEGIVTARR